MKTTTLTLLVIATLTLLGASTRAQTTPAHPPIRVACVGDSITQGAMSTNPYPAQLSALLGPGWDVKNFGVSGRTLLKKGDFPYWNEQAYTDARAFAPNVVVIMLGTNDTKPQNWKYFDEFVADFKNLVESFTNLPSHPKVFLCRPCPVFGAGNYGINEPNLDQEIPVIDQVAHYEDAAVIDIHAALAGQPRLEPDNVHPNADGDAIMAKVIAKALTAR
jgi:lysophospholipase L1-like esterase